MVAMTPDLSSLFSPSLSSLFQDGEQSCEKKARGGKSPKAGELSSGSKGKRKSSPKTGSGKGKLSSGKKKSPTQTQKVKQAENESTRQAEISAEDSESEAEVSFEDYSELCQRMAKTMYYSSPLPSTPRPSLPLTILAVDTFTKYARKDTLEFLDIDMAAEIGRNACVSPTALVFALVYLERLSVNNPGYLKTVKPSELFVVSLLVASKFVQDDDEDLGIYNDEWATSAKMELKRINQLELEFLTAIDWRVNIGNLEYQEALRNIEKKLAQNEGVKRGWLTYTECTNANLPWNAVMSIIYERIFEVVSATCLMYTTLFATFITSSVLAPHLLSISKLILASGTSSLSCSEMMSSPNMSTPFSQTGNLEITRQRYVPGELILPLEEDENNSSDTTGEPEWKERVNNILLQHRRYVETPSHDYGLSLKCDSPQCHNEQEQAFAQVVHRVIGSLLHSRSSNTAAYSNGMMGNSGFRSSCMGTRNCMKSSAGSLSKAKPLRV